MSSFYKFLLSAMQTLEAFTTASVFILMLAAMAGIAVKHLGGL